MSATVAHRTTLPALTSLRFAAAALIVIGHADSTFGSLGLAEAMPLEQGVSFFFVLSGFILYYNYPEFRSPREVSHFIIARVARIWPTHVICLLIFLIFLPRALWYVPYPTPTFWTLFVLDVTLVQSLIPIKSVFLSLNGVAWSISTEMVFYILFPILIIYKRHWRSQFAMLFLVLLFTGYVIVENKIPVSSDPQGLSALGLLYTNPFVRLIEFLAGIVSAQLFLRSRAYRLGQLATVAEVLAIGVTVAALCSLPPLVARPWARSPWGSVAAYWLQNEGAFPLFALLIVIAGRQEGLVTRLLSARWLVFLGEASFSIYLIHTTLLRGWAVRLYPAMALPLWLQYVMFWLLLLASASLVHILVERPARTLILRCFRKPK